MCRVEGATITSLLVGLEKKGLVERKVLENNRREKRIYLTESGKAKVQDLVVAFRKLHEICSAGLSEEEMEQIMQDDSNCLLTFTLTMEDGRVITYRFYPYSERHAMVSVTGDGIRPTTEFYTSSAAVRRIANATRDLMTGVEIDPDHRYG